MTKTERKSHTGGTITEYFNELGQRTRVVHTAGKAYSGRAAEAEQKKPKG
jgi:hypothetical protein